MTENFPPESETCWVPGPSDRIVVYPSADPLILPKIDEIVLTGVTVHLEMLADNVAWLGLLLPDGRRIAVSLRAPFLLEDDETIVPVTVLNYEPASADLLAEVRSRKADIMFAAEQYGMSNIRVFGSVVRGEARPDSDIDLLVDFDVEQYGLSPLAGFRIAVRDILGRDVDVATLSLLRDDIRVDVDTQAVLL